MTGEPAYLFVYGTLRRNEGHPAHGLLAAGRELVGSARIQGRLYEIAGYPGAVVSSVKGEYVVGEVFRLIDSEAVLAALDDYEEAAENYPEPREYRRCRVGAKLEDGREIVAWCYLYNRPTDGLRLIPDGDWCP